MIMMIDTYKEKDKKVPTSKLASAFKEGSYQASLDSLLHSPKKTKFSLPFGKQ